MGSSLYGRWAFCALRLRCVYQGGAYNECSCDKNLLHDVGGEADMILIWDFDAVSPCRRCCHAAMCLTWRSCSRGGSLVRPRRSCRLRSARPMTLSARRYPLTMWMQWFRYNATSISLRPTRTEGVGYLVLACIFRGGLGSHVSCLSGQLSNAKVTQAFCSCRRRNPKFSSWRSGACVMLYMSTRYIYKSSDSYLTQPHMCCKAAYCLRHRTWTTCAHSLSDV